MWDWLPEIFDRDAASGYAQWLLRSDWPRLALVIGVAAAVVLAVWLYRREQLSRRWRITLATLRGLLLAALVIAAFEPVLAVELNVRLKRTLLVLVDTSRSMSIADVDDRSRFEAVNAMLSDRESDLLRRLSRDSDVRLYSFGEGLESHEIGSAAFAVRDARTGLGDALYELSERHRGTAETGVIVFTDGRSNAGRDPAQVAATLAARGMPVYTVGLGAPDPPDAALDPLMVQQAAFVGDRVPVHVRIRTSGLSNVAATLEATLDGVPMQRRPIALQRGTHVESFEITPTARNDAAQLVVRVSLDPTVKEATDANNTAEASIRVIDQKIKVLYLEGKPRWEYRYLRAVLLRDPRIEARFVMLEGDQALAQVSDEFLPRFPATPQELFEYDLLILGDVPPGAPQQMEQVAQLVRERGGSVLFLAGRHHMPAAYAGTALAAVMPVTPTSGPRVTLDRDAFPALTPAGRRSPVVMLEQDQRLADVVWSLVRPMYDLPAVAGLAPGAVALLEVPIRSRSEPGYPLVAWHRYGSGKAMYVGTDALWRLRFRRGDEYHARFWGQAIGFLTMSRLLGENRRVQIQTDRSTYQLGERVQVYASVADESFAPVERDAYEVALKPATPDGSTQSLSLRPLPGAPGMYVGEVSGLTAGRYTLHAVGPDEDAANAAAFDVHDVDLEMADPTLHRELLEQIADRTGGRYVEPADVAKLPELLDREAPVVVQRRQYSLWDHPAVLALLIGLATVEWFVRRKQDLV